MTATIGSITPAIGPNSDMTIVREDKPCAFKLTYSGVAYFAWDATIIGKVITVPWNVMAADDFDDYDELYRDDSLVEFDPDDGSNRTFMVKIIGLNGKYCRGKAYTYRKDVAMQLLIMSEVSE